MKNVQLYAPDLKLKLLTALTVIGRNLEEGGVVAATNVKFVENGDIQEAKLILQTKETTVFKGKEILHFSGVIVTKNDTRRPCIGYHYTDELLEECWMTIIDQTAEIFETTTIGKTEFIKLTKEYYRAQEIEFTEDGNRAHEFKIFQNPPKPGGPLGMLVTLKRDIEVYTDMYNNLFPICRKKEEGHETIFGEFIDEHLIRICSGEEAFVRGVMNPNN